MRIKIELLCERPFKLPVGYNSFLQGLIYTHLGDEEATWLHEHGFMHGNRSFKLFTFSLFLERAKYDKNKKELEFPGEVSFYINSPVEWILQQLAQNFISSEYVMVGNNRLTVASVSVENTEKINDDKARVRAVTPIEVHSTYQKPNGKKRTEYINPFDNDFGELVNTNLKKKWEVFYKEECPHEISIKPMYRDNKKERICYFGTGENATIIKGWSGHYMISGDPAMLNFALDVGIGSSNSQGFGMIEVVEKKSEGVVR